MPTIYRNVFTPEICQELIELPSSLSETFLTFGGIEAERSITSERRSPIPFYLHQLSEQESLKYCNIIYDRIPKTKATAFRIMQYPTGSCIRAHYDTTYPPDGESNSGLILQLADPKSYSGGYLTIEGQYIDLNIGDAVHYSYSDLHEVRTIKSGERWILNVRMFTEE